MKKLLLLTIFLFQTIFGIGSLAISQVEAAGLADPEDIFIVSSPAPDSTVNGQTPISIRAYDDDQEKISFFAKLFDRNTCYENQIGRVTDESELQSKKDENSVVDWNTFETSNSSNIEDGSYCLQICLFLKNGDTAYSACNSRVVVIANNNSRPEFIDFPEKIDAKENEDFSYQFKSEDPDGDKITYRIKNGPDSVSIDQNTGLLNGKIENVDKNSEFETTVQITDSNGASNEKTFLINISNSEDSGEEPVKVTLEITSPTEGYTQTNKYLKVEWKTENKEQVQKYKIEISSDLENWQTLAEEISTNQKYFLADVSEFSDGEYYVRLTALLDGEQDVTAVSNKFNISVKADAPTEVENTIQIFQVVPENGSKILKSNFKEITGKFVAGENSEVKVDTFEIKLDGKVLEGCDINAEAFSCKIEEIDLGLHSVEAKISDSNGVENKLDWNFEIVNEIVNEKPTSTNNDVTIFGRTLSRSLFIFILLICCIASVLVLTPWLLYFLWSRSTKRNEKVVSTVEFEKTPKQPLVERNTYVTPSEDTSYIYSPNNTEVTAEPIPAYTEVEPVEETQKPINLGERKEVKENKSQETIYPNNQEDQTQESNENTYASGYTPLENSSEVYTNTGSAEPQLNEQDSRTQETSDNQLIEPYTPNEFEEAQNSSANSSQPYLDPTLNPQNTDSLAKETDVAVNQDTNNSTVENNQTYGSDVQYPSKPTKTDSEESDGKYVEPTIQN